VSARAIEITILSNEPTGFIKINLVAPPVFAQHGDSKKFWNICPAPYSSELLQNGDQVMISVWGDLKLPLHIRLYRRIGSLISMDSRGIGIRL